MNRLEEIKKEHEIARGFTHRLQPLWWVRVQWLIAEVEKLRSTPEREEESDAIEGERNQAIDRAEKAEAEVEHLSTSCKRLTNVCAEYRKALQEIVDSGEKYPTSHVGICALKTARRALEGNDEREATSNTRNVRDA